MPCGPVSDSVQIQPGTGICCWRRRRTPRFETVDQMMCRGLLTEAPTADPWPLAPVTVSTASWGTKAIREVVLEA